MSRPHEINIKAAAMQFLTVLLIGLGLSLTSLKALMPAAALWPAALICLLFSLAFQGLYLMPLRHKWALPLALAAGIAVWGITGGGPVHTVIQLAKALFLSLRGIPDAVTPYADTARWTLCFIFTLLAAALVWDDTLPLAAFSVITILVLIFIFSPREHLLWYALPAMVGLLLMMAQGKEKRWSALPLAAILTVLALILVPARPETNPQLAKLSSDIRQFVEDYLLFNEFRSSFSLTTEGYQPVENRLGGPATPEKHKVMEVETSRPILLRGKTYNEYNGLNWFDTLSSRRYLYSSPRFTALRDRLFDLNLPLAESNIAPETVRVHMLRSDTTTLFTHTLMRSLQTESERMVTYFNLGSELFITRDTETGDRYTMTYLPYIAGSGDTARMAAACAQLPDAHYEEVAKDYLTLPRHIQSEIHQLAQEAAGSAQTPYEKALNIMYYLRSHYGYTLDVEQPPDGVDFVAWFLIGEKSGYCTYFASAMTVMCRIVGVPARYVTGYMASPDQTGVALVTGKEAHAWTEIYLNGFGWLAMDATPQSGSDHPTDGEGGSGNYTPPRNQDATPAPTPSPKNAITPTPSPTATPTPAPSPTPLPDGVTPDPNSPQEQEPNGDAPGENNQTPTPPPGQMGLSTPTPPPGAAGGSVDFARFPWGLLILILLILLLVLRYMLTEPLRHAARKKDDAALILFAAITALVGKRGIDKKPQETLHEFAARADRELAGGQLPALWPLADQIAGQVYGRHPADATPFRQSYLTLRHAAKPWTRFALMLKRMFTFGNKK